MLIRVFLYFILVKIYQCFHLNYKILSKNKYHQNYVKNIHSVNYIHRFQHIKYSQKKNKLFSFFSNFFNKDTDKFKLNKEEKEYLTRIGVNDANDYKLLTKAHEEYIDTVTDIKSKLKYKDTFFFITQKLIQKNLYDFKQKQKYNIFGKDEYTSELSINYIKNSNIEEKFKEHILKKLNDELSNKKYTFLRIFKWKSALDIFNISTLMLPVTAIGFFLSKMGLFSVVVNMLLTSHFLTFKKDEKRKMKISTLLLTAVPILIHSSIGFVCNGLFWEYFKFNIPNFIKKENVLSLFINTQLYIASLIYFVNNDENEEEEDHEEYNNDYMDFNDVLNVDENT
ncbi:conserved Plasmodium protein, unknown function [Plasmodium reichenowi]|uniref:Uncharacterized protein n=1 Tax=Plasmodium reichenowi TaxID=5854 RepID=A0A060RVI5_PLARE|nr:conserved Plasmodium protein, unknown function [Plasmodium reichenowi]